MLFSGNTYFVFLYALSNSRDMPFYVIRLFGISMAIFSKVVAMTTILSMMTAGCQLLWDVT